MFQCKSKMTRLLIISYKICISFHQLSQNVYQTICLYWFGWHVILGAGSCNMIFFLSGKEGIW